MKKTAGKPKCQSCGKFLGKDTKVSYVLVNTDTNGYDEVWSCENCKTQANERTRNN